MIANLDFDSDGFDPIQYINERFPSESSLDDLDSFIISIGLQISSLDEEISRAVQTQSLSDQQTSKDVTYTQQSIVDLFEKISDIKTKALQSERMVQEICADIKKLDYAKTNLQTSITSMKRLQMLTTAVGQLENLAHEYQYRDAANLLDAVKQLLSHFDTYDSIPFIAEIRAKVDIIQNDLKKHVHSTFREIGQLVDSVADASLMINDLPGNMKSLSDACLVVDALGITCRKELLEEFVQVQLIPYEKLFGPEKLHFTLDQVERRWAWFKRLKKTVEAKFNNIFPQQWKLNLRLCVEFVERTKLHIVQLLSAMESRNQTDVNALLKALQTALRFEQELSAMFESHFSNISDVSSQFTQNTANPYDLPEAVEATSKKVASKAREDEDELEYVRHAQRTISGDISGSFDKFMGSYVLLERQNLEELLQRLSKEEDTANNDERQDRRDNNVYGSSMSMFVFIKNSIKRCTALTNGQTFLSLTNEFKACMQKYTQVLRTRCPQPVGQVYRLPVGSEVAICYLINTAEYCSEVIPQLEESIKQRMDPQYASKVDLSTEVDAFVDLMAHSLKVLTSGIMDRLEPGFRVMNSLNVATLVQVAEESTYIHTFNNILIESMPTIRDSLSGSYFNNFCLKLATEVLVKYLDIIMKQKKISEMGTQQLLLDTYSLKTMLMQLHNLGNKNSEKSSSSTKVTTPLMYSKLVASRSAYIETILKLLGTPEELLIERFKIMLPEGQLSDLVSLMDKKGMNRQQQQLILDSYNISGGSTLLEVKNKNSSGNIAALSSVTSNLAISASASVAKVAQDLSSSAERLGGNLKWK